MLWLILDSVETFGRKGWVKRVLNASMKLGSMVALDQRLGKELEKLLRLYKMERDGALLEAAAKARTYPFETALVTQVQVHLQAHGGTQEAAVAALAANDKALQELAQQLSIDHGELRDEIREYHIEVMSKLDALDDARVLQPRDGGHASEAGTTRRRAPRELHLRLPQVQTPSKRAGERSQRPSKAVDAGRQRRQPEPQRPRNGQLVTHFKESKATKRRRADSTPSTGSARPGQPRAQQQPWPRSSPCPSRPMKAPQHHPRTRAAARTSLNYWATSTPIWTSSASCLVWTAPCVARPRSA